MSPPVKVRDHCIAGPNEYWDSHNRLKIQARKFLQIHLTRPSKKYLSGDSLEKKRRILSVFSSRSSFLVYVIMSIFWDHRFSSLRIRKKVSFSLRPGGSEQDNCMPERDYTGRLSVRWLFLYNRDTAVNGIRNILNIMTVLLKALFAWHLCHKYKILRFPVFDTVLCTNKNVRLSW